MNDNFLEVCFPFDEEYLVAGQVTGQVAGQVKALINVMVPGKAFTRAELMKKLSLRHRETFSDNYLKPALNVGVVEMTLPDKPNSRNQKYRLCNGNGIESE